MRLHSLALSNIRSYTNQTIEFPQGMVLLAGDIGSGKSTLLFAIEFALFGLRRGELAGSALLRHGAKEGYVELTFFLHKQKITVKRALKRSATSVGQDAGVLTIDGKAIDCTAVELKSRILELLSYPESLILQQKSFVFRYTVYTPQEQMKHILLEKPEERIDTLRKLFLLDKYKIIREHATLLSRSLKQDAQKLLGIADDLPQLLVEQQTLNETLLSKTKAFLFLQQKSKDALAQKEHALKTYETQEKVWNMREEKMRTHKSLLVQIEHKMREQERLNKEVLGISQALIQLPKEAPDISSLQTSIRSIDLEQQDTQKKILENATNAAKADMLIEQAKKTTTNILDLNSCPTCKQDVNEHHKHTITQEQNEKIAKIVQRKEQIIHAKETLQKKFDEKNSELKTLQKQLLESANIISQYNLRKNYEEQKKNKELHLQQLLQEIAPLTKEEENIKQELLLPFDTKQLEKLRSLAQQTENALRETLILCAREEEAIKNLEVQKHNLVKKIEQKTHAKKQAMHIVEQNEWLTKHFSQLMFTIEKHVLMVLYHQCNDAFKEFFDALIEDELISVRLDHDFSPLVEQNGYETTIENLSGGEKTAVALAYRLALNKVINQALPQLKTDGLLILDEPTDGFSSEQLDRVQEVLTTLGLEQILIVSHEPKMESFVDHVIRVVKTEHESTIN